MKIEPVTAEVEHIIYTLARERRKAPFPPGACRAYPLLAAVCRALRRTGVPYTIKRKAKQTFYPHRVALLLVADRKLLIDKEEEAIEAAREPETVALFYHVQKLLLRAPFVALAESYRQHRDEKVTTTIKRIRAAGTVNAYTAAYLSLLCTRLKVEQAIRWTPASATMLVDFDKLRYIPREAKDAALNDAKRAMWLSFCVEKITVTNAYIEVD